jgi:uncharacterized membrane protein (UPF0127 family)
MMMLSLLFAAAVAATPAPQHLPTIDVRAPKATLTLQIANTEPERELGLMSVTALPPHTGMVFVFPQDDEVGFWMKDTFIPLDMVFVGPGGVVRVVDANVPSTTAETPDDRIPRRNARAMYVIELAAGDAAKDGIIVGTRLGGLTALHTDQ